MIGGAWRVHLCVRPGKAIIHPGYWYTVCRVEGGGFPRNITDHMFHPWHQPRHPWLAIGTASPSPGYMPGISTETSSSTPMTGTGQMPWSTFYVCSVYCLLRHVLTFAFYDINCLCDGLIYVWLCVTCYGGHRSLCVLPKFFLFCCSVFRTAFRWSCVLCPPWCWPVPDCA